MIISPSVGQPELNPYAGRIIHRFTLTQRRFEFDLLCRSHRRLVEAVPQAAYDSIDLDTPVGQEYHINNDVAFNLQTTPFRGVLWPRFVQYVRSVIRRSACHRLLLRRFRGRRRDIAESSGNYRPLLSTATYGWYGRPISESRACHRSADPFFSSGAIPVAFATRERRRTQTIHVRPFIWIALSGYAVGVTESAGLHFADGRNHCRHCGATGAQISDLYIFLWSFRAVVLHVNLGRFKRGRHFGRFHVNLFHLGHHRLGFRQVREDVWLGGVQFHWLHGNWLGFHFGHHGLRLGWRRGLWCNGDFGQRLSDLHAGEIQGRLHLLGIEQRYRQQKCQNGKLHERAEAQPVPVGLRIR